MYRFWWLIGLLLLGVTSQAQTAAKGLVGYWSFSQCSLSDQSATARASLSQHRLECTLGRQGEALRLRGVTALQQDRADTVQLENTPVLRPSQGFSLALWFKLESESSFNENREVVSDGAQTLFAKSDDRKGLTLRLERSKGDGLWYLYALNGRCCNQVTAPLEVAFGHGGVRVGEWHFVVLTQDAVLGEWRLYQDALLKSRVTDADFNLNPQSDAEVMYLGSERGGVWYPFAGLLDEVRLYDRALSSNEVLGLYAGRAP